MEHSRVQLRLAVRARTNQYNHTGWTATSPGWEMGRRPAGVTRLLTSVRTWNSHILLNDSSKQNVSPDFSPLHNSGLILQNIQCPAPPLCCSMRVYMSNIYSTDSPGLCEPLGSYVWGTGHCAQRHILAVWHDHCGFRWFFHHLLWFLSPEGTHGQEAANWLSLVSNLEC